MRIELAEILLNPIPEIETRPRSDENLFEWVSFIKGPDGSVYEDGLFEFEDNVLLYFRMISRFNNAISFSDEGILYIVYFTIIVIGTVKS